MTLLFHESPKYLLTSESVTEGHPDKLCDQISDGVLDAIFDQDPYSRVACETMVTTGLAIISGEITTKAVVDYQDVVRQVIREVGYTDDEMGICADTCAVLVTIGRQSPDIAQGVNENEDSRLKSILGYTHFLGYKQHHQGIRIDYFLKNQNRWPHLKISSYSNGGRIAESLEASSIKDMGKIMGALKQKYADVIDFSKVNIIIKSLLN